MRDGQRVVCRKTRDDREEQDTLLPMARRAASGQLQTSFASLQRPPPPLTAAAGPACRWPLHLAVGDNVILRTPPLHSY